MTWPEIYPTEDGDPNHLPWEFKCSVIDCTWQTYHHSQESANKEKERHRQITCPYDGGIYMGDNLHEKMWNLLDKSTREVMEMAAARKTGTEPTTPEEDATFNELRGATRAYSEAVRVLASPAYEAANLDPAKHAVARYRANQRGEEMPQTPGINGYNPHLDQARSKELTAEAKASAAARVEKIKSETETPVKQKGGKVLGAEQIEQIKKGLGAKLPASSLASVYKVPVSVVEEIAASMEGASA